MVRFFVTGLSHHTAPLEVRESLAKMVTPARLALRRFSELEALEQLVIISTCNRVELYVCCSGLAQDCVKRIWRQVSKETGLAEEDLAPHLYTHYGPDAFSHLFRVSSSLDSMVVGEPQILGQVKDAYQFARNTGTVGPKLNKIFEKAFYVAKRVRTETGIAENAVSMSFAAVELGKEIFDSLVGKKVLVIGAGKMSVLAAKHLRNSGIQEIRVANRSLVRAKELADQVDGTAYPLSDTAEQLVDCDIVISSTAAPEYIVDKKMMSGVVRRRRYRPILFVDIAVPRDIDPALDELENVFVYDVDDLQDVIRDNRESRAKEAMAAEHLIATELEEFVKWNRAQLVVPTVKALRQRTFELAQEELRRGGVLSGPKLEATANAVTNKLLHPVLRQLRSAGEEGDPGPFVDFTQKLFDLTVDSSGSADSIDVEREPAATVVPINKKSESGT